MSTRRLTREETRQRTRAAILERARALFSERGYRGASIDQIADAAGFSKGAVYSNWASKEELFLDLLDQDRAGQGPNGADPGEAPPDLSVQATGWALATLDFFLDAVRSPKTRAVLAERYRAVRREVGTEMSAGRPDPSWISWPELATVAMALGSGLIIQSALDPEAVDPALAARVIQHLLADAATDPG